MKVFRGLWRLWRKFRFRNSFYCAVRWNDVAIWIVAIPVIEGDERPLPPLPWGQVEKVLAFKKDNFSTDEICLLFVRENDQCIEVSEEDQGYNELIAELKNHLPGFPPLEEWFVNVAFPAFKTNPTTLWQRS